MGTKVTDILSLEGVDVEYHVRWNDNGQEYVSNVGMQIMYKLGHWVSPKY
jgi:hypothetical protein